MEVNLYNSAQLAIVILTGTAIWMVTRTESWSRWGHVFGLASQPFHLWVLIYNEQWITIILWAWFTYSWIQGIYLRFLRGRYEC